MRPRQVSKLQPLDTRLEQRRVEDDAGHAAAGTGPSTACRPFWSESESNARRGGRPTPACLRASDRAVGSGGGAEYASSRRGGGRSGRRRAAQITRELVRVASRPRRGLERGRDGRPGVVVQHVQYDGRRRVRVRPTRHDHGERHVGLGYEFVARRRSPRLFPKRDGHEFGGARPPSASRRTSSPAVTPSTGPHPRPLCGIGGDTRSRRPRDEGFLDLRIDLVGREFLKHLELFGFEQRGREHVDRRLVLLEVPVEPVERRHLEVLGVLVRALGDDQPEIVLGGAGGLVNRAGATGGRGRRRRGGRSCPCRVLAMSSGRGATRAATWPKSQR